MSKEEKPKVKRPTAQKRTLRSLKQKGINRSFKSSIRTTVREFESALTARATTELPQTLNALYSALDKAVKRGLYKPNKTARLKARAAKKVFLQRSAA